MKTRRRSAKKLLLPLIALGMMIGTMYYDGSHQPHASAQGSMAAARVAPALHTR